jgi:acyl carrier protein
MTVQDELRAFIINELKFQGSAVDLGGDLQLIEEEVIDSLGIMEIVAFLEERFGIEILDEEIVLTNFGTLDAMTRLVDSKVKAGG